jgi:hypothetical protein
VIAQERLGHLDQMALATDRPAIDARAIGGIELRILDRSRRRGRRRGE